MKKIVLLAFVLMLFSLAVVLGLPTPVGTDRAEIVVPDDHKEIQWAINNASDGDTIFVRAGVYYEYVTINKSVALIGENKYNTIIDGNGTGSVVYITANNVKFTCFTIQNSGSTYPDSGIRLEYSGGKNITHNIVTNNKFGIFVRHSSNNALTGNIVSNNLHGIELMYSTENVLINNRASNNSCGILLHESDNNMLVDNTVPHNNFGIVLGYSDNNMLVNNTVSNGEWTGIRIVDYSIGNMLINNTASSNLDGFELTYADDNTLVSNIASHNRRYGIAVGYSNDSMLVSNRVLNNVYGIRVSESSSNNTIYHNNFINNTWQAYIILSPLNTMWDDGYPSGGNYWSDYAGVDLYSGRYQNETGSDGIADTS